MRYKKFSTHRLAWICSLLAGGSIAAQDSKHELGGASAPLARVAAASEEGEQAVKRFTLQPRFKADLIAAEPHLANPVAFSIDEQGRFYVAETFRLHAGVGDIRGLMPWLDEELAAVTVDDRLAEMKRHLGAKVSDWGTHSDRVKMLVDKDGDGKVDASTVFAGGFNDYLDGLGAGVLAREGVVYFANIPSLWMLKDHNGDGIADTRASLHRGYGVRVGFLGHDLHGLCFGPDGRLYFSVGDRGASVTVDGRTVGRTDTGAVFRCNPDGSDLEMFAFGLRNPQELAFDQFGNLWTGDNNSDSGDKARWVYVVEGGDSGWRIGYQFLERPYSRGPFNAEKLWHPQHAGQSASIVPPIANVANGPSGLAYYPGTGLPEEYAGHFFLVDFKGGAGNSGVHSFAVRPKGASFELVDQKQFAWNILATDVEFGPDAGLFVSDWVHGWDLTGKGRIYRLHQPEVSAAAAAMDTGKLIRAGMSRRSTRELSALLGHPDMRVRQSAQFALARKGSPSVRVFSEVARKDTRQLARLHAIWGLGQIAQVRSQIPVPVVTEAMSPLVPLLGDADAEVRAQAARVLGDGRHFTAYEGLVRLLGDPSLRVRFFAVQALGKLSRPEALGSIGKLLRENNDQDVYLRHAAVMALTRLGDVEGLKLLGGDASPSVRLGALLAMRRLQRPEILSFLSDPDESLVLEAARAINDEPIHGAQAELAALMAKESQNEPLLRRVLNANFRHGTKESAAALARFASDSSNPEAMRAEALAALSDWPTPSGRDRVLGLWRPLAHARDAQAPSDALKPLLGELFKSPSGAVKTGVAHAVGKLRIAESLPYVSRLALDLEAAPPSRVAALRSIALLDAAGLEGVLNSIQNDSSEDVRKEATRLASSLRSSGVLGRLKGILERGSVGEKQAAFAALGKLEGMEASTLLKTWMERLTDGSAPKELGLDILEASSKRPEPLFKELIAKFESTRPKHDHLGVDRVTLHGGDAAAGKQIFLERADVACVRCHQVDGEGGEVGPVLTGIGAKQTREYLLESIILPNRAIASGFESLIVTMKDGAAYAGILRSETGTELVVNSPEDGLLKLKKADITAREKGLSAMPEEMTKILTRQELRNLVEYLATLK